MNPTNIGKRLVKAPKVYVRDSGIVHALLNIADYNNLLSHPLVQKLIWCWNLSLTNVGLQKSKGAPSQIFQKAFILPAMMFRLPINLLFTPVKIPLR